MTSAHKNQTLASRATGWSKSLGPAFVVCLIAFLFSMFVPLLTTRAFLFRNEIVLARIAYDLFHFDKFLFLIVFVFGVVIPLIKLVVSILCWFLFEISVAERCSRKLRFLAKLSMLDIMLLALFIVAFKGVGIGTVQIRYGLYLYATVVVSAFLLNQAMDNILEKLPGQNCRG